MRRCRPLLAVPALALSLLAGCGDDDETVKVEETVISVSTTQAVSEQLIETVTGTGSIAAHKKTDVGPRVDGIIQKVFVRVGDRVKEGDPLFQTNDEEFRLKVKELENRLILARSEFKNAKKAYERIKALHDKGVASTGQMDNAQVSYDAARAQVGIAESQLAKAEKDLKDATVTAPFDGVITRQDVYEGKFMATRMGGGGGMGMGGGGGGGGVVELMKIDIVAAIVDVPENALSKISVGSPAKIYIDGMDQVYDSQIHILNDAIDVATRSVELRLGIANPDYAIKPGLFARAEIFAPPRDAILLDRGAVLGPESGRYVYVPEQGHAKKVNVTVRQVDARRVEIVSGLAAGSEVLIGPGLALLIDGAPIKIIGNEPTPGAAALSDAATTGIKAN